MTARYGIHDDNGADIWPMRKYIRVRKYLPEVFSQLRKYSRVRNNIRYPDSAGRGSGRGGARGIVNGQPYFVLVPNTISLLPVFRKRRKPSRFCVLYRFTTPVREYAGAFHNSLMRCRNSVTHNNFDTFINLKLLTKKTIHKYFGRETS